MKKIILSCYLLALFLSNGETLTLPNYAYDTISHGSPLPNLKISANLKYLVSHNWGARYQCQVKKVLSGNLSTEKISLDIGVVDQSMQNTIAATPKQDFIIEFEPCSTLNPFPCISGFSDKQNIYWAILTIKPATSLKTAPVLSARAKARQQGYHPVICNRYLLGGTLNGQWVKEKEMPKFIALIQGGENYNLYANQQYLGTALGSRVTIEAGPYIWYGNIDMQYLDTDNKVENFDARVAICGNWNVFPRLPKILNHEIATYKTIVANYLKEKGLAATLPVKINQIIKVDLEGDGLDEILISASNIKGIRVDNEVFGYAQKNTYAIVLLRKMYKGKVQTLPLAGVIFTEKQDLSNVINESYDISFVGDLNGDSIMEILVHEQYYEGFYWLGFTIENGLPKEVLSGGVTV